ncbi:MAG: hypothetical protein Q8903_12860 [Bacteroidota bacterium]|nr:hypothetical protein [Bacteroidota bacterium]
MKKVFLAFLLIFTISETYSQFEIRGGMGINYFSSPSLFDYLNINFAGNSQVSSFSSIVKFSGEAGYYITPSSEVSVELGYSINSFTYDYSIGHYDLSYNIVAPTVFYYYVIPGQGYNFKFGAGAGLSFLSATEDLSYSKLTYKSTGFGIDVRADGNTALSNNLYINIGGDIRYDVIPSPKANGANLMDRSSKINFNSFMVGVRLGLTYIF